MILHLSIAGYGFYLAIAGYNPCLDCFETRLSFFGRRGKFSAFKREWSA